MIAGIMKLRSVFPLLLLALPLVAQLPAPNKAGVSAGHDVFRAKDVAEANKFWQSLGGQPVQFAGRLNLIKFPGVLILEIGNGGRPAADGAPPPPPVELAGSE